MVPVGSGQASGGASEQSRKKHMDSGLTGQGFNFRVLAYL